MLLVLYRINVWLNRTYANKISIAMFSLLKGFMMVIAPVVAFIWIEDDEHLDCVAGISMNDEPICTGVFIKAGVVLTSANPFQTILGNYTMMRTITLSHLIFAYDEQQTDSCWKIQYNQCFRHQNWVRVGHDYTHSTIHDLLIMGTQDIRYDPIRPFEVTYHFRRHFFTPIATNQSYYSPDDVWYFAGFGFVDESHLNHSYILEVEYLNVGTQTDCDEWIPREWGAFLCFHDFNNLAGVPSGAPLFHGSNFIPGLSPVYGIGAFSLTKSKETILVFTDLRHYTHKLHHGSWVKYDGDLLKPFLDRFTKFDPRIDDHLEVIKYSPDLAEPVIPGSGEPGSRRQGGPSTTTPRIKEPRGPISFSLP